MRDIYLVCCNREPIEGHLKPEKAQSRRTELEKQFNRDCERMIGLIEPKTYTVRVVPLIGAK